MNLMMLLEMAAQGFGDRVAFVSGDESLTYQQLYDAAGQAAAQLRNSDCDYMGMLDVSTLALPVGLFIVLYQLNPEYCAMLWTDPLGKQMLAVAIVMQILGALMIRQIINIKV